MSKQKFRVVINLVPIIPSQEFSVADVASWVASKIGPGEGMLIGSVKSVREMKSEKTRTFSYPLEHKP